MVNKLLVRKTLILSKCTVLQQQQQQQQQQKSFVGIRTLDKTCCRRITREHLVLGTENVEA
jgi:hypothetical protein